MKPWTCLGFYSLGIVTIALIFSSSIEMPFLDTIWPKNFPCLTMKMHFFGFKSQYNWHFSIKALSWDKLSILYQKWASSQIPSIWRAVFCHYYAQCSGDTRTFCQLNECQENYLWTRSLQSHHLRYLDMSFVLRDETGLHHRFLAPPNIMVIPTTMPAIFNSQSSL